MVGWTYNADIEIHGIGFGSHKVGDMKPVGPCVSGMIDGRGNRSLNHGWAIQEGGLPGVTASALPLLFAAAAKIVGVDTDDGLVDGIKESVREVQSKLMGAYTGAVNRTQTYLVMLQDDSGGRM